MNKANHTSKVVMIYSLVIFFLSIPYDVHPQSNAEKFGAAISKYLMATDMMEKLKKSKCGYILNKSYSLKKTITEVLPYFPKTHQNEMKKKLTDKEFIDYDWNDKLISTFIKTKREEGLDDKTTCDMIVTKASILYEQAKEEWDYTKVNIRYH